MISRLRICFVLIWLDDSSWLESLLDAKAGDDGELGEAKVDWSEVTVSLAAFIIALNDWDGLKLLN